jgi:hypothetical protein
MVEEDYEDHLKGDPATLDELTKSKFLSRRKKENRLSSLISIWKEGTDFMEFLRAIDDEAYKKETLNYRNRHSHIIGPRLGLGHVQFVTRRVTQYTDINKQPDGSYEPILTDRVSACYSAGRGTPPLDLEKAHAANLEQYRRVRKCYESYRKLLATGMEVMPLAS